MSHVHEWRETTVFCEDCGDHPAILCDADIEGCPYEEPIDLIHNDDPRVGDYSWVFAAGLVKSRPLLMESTSTYMVWVEDWDDVGHEAMVNRERDSGDAYEYLGSHPTPIDGDFTVLKVDDYAYHWHAHEGEHCGPWRVCPFQGCGRLGYPAYGVDPTCYQHSVRGCDRRDLPEKEFA